MRSISRVIFGLSLLAPINSAAQTLPGGSIHLSWDDCYLNSTDSWRFNKSFSCNGNSGPAFLLFASVIPPAGLQQYVGSIAVFDVQSATPALPLWWTFQAGGCRPSTNLTAAPSSGLTSCLDLSDNTQFGGIDYAAGLPEMLPYRARLRTAYAMDAALAHPLTSTEELTVLQISINRNRTTGVGACAGCSTPVCIVFNSLLLDQVDPNLPRGLVTSGEQQWVTWQGASDAVSCPAATPVETRTWGQIKSLYR